MAEETSGREQESFLGDVFGVEAKLTSFSLPLSVFDGEEQASVGAVDVCCDATLATGVLARLDMGNGRLAARLRTYELLENGDADFLLELSRDFWARSTVSSEESSS